MHTNPIPEERTQILVPRGPPCQAAACVPVDPDDVLVQGDRKDGAPLGDDCGDQGGRGSGWSGGVRFCVGSGSAASLPHHPVHGTVDDCRGQGQGTKHTNRPGGVRAVVPFQGMGGCIFTPYTP